MADPARAGEPGSRGPPTLDIIYHIDKGKT